MADYAKKGRPKQPTKSRGGRGKKAQSQGTPRPRLWLMLFLVLLVAGAFGYFLLYIEGSAAKQPSKAKVVVVKKTQKPIPKANIKTWQYEKLNEKSVDVEFKEQVAAKKPYRLQCASVKSLQHAQTLKAQIAFQNQEALIKKVTSKNNSIWYQVYLGPFDRKRDAEVVRHKLQRANFNHCEIFYWQG